MAPFSQFVPPVGKQAFVFAALIKETLVRLIKSFISCEFALIMIALILD